MKSIKLHISSNALQVSLRRAKWTVLLTDLIKFYKLVSIIISQYFMGTFDICTNGDNQVLKKLLDTLHTFKNENDVQVQQASTTWTRIYTFYVNDELYSSLCLWTKFVSSIRFANWMSNLITLTISEDGSDSFFKSRREAFDLLDSVYALAVFFKKVVEPVYPLTNGQEDYRSIVLESLYQMVYNGSKFTSFKVVRSRNAQEFSRITLDQYFVALSIHMTIVSGVQKHVPRQSTQAG